MSQVTTITLPNEPGGAFRSDLNNILAAIASHHFGDAAPSNPQPGWIWVDSNTPSTTIWTMYIYSGSAWVGLALINAGTGVATPINSVPAGSVLDFAGSTPPQGFLLCAGQNVSRATYSLLFGVIGTIYGTGDGATTFTLPDLRGRTTFGIGNMGGTESSRLNLIISSVLGAVGGQQTESAGVSVSVGGNTGGSLAVAGNAQGGNGFDGTLLGAGGAYLKGDSALVVSGFTGGSLSVSASGGGATSPVTNVPPGMALNKMISTGGA